MDYTLQFDLTAEDWFLLLNGAWRTIVFSVGGMIVGLAIGILCAIWRVSGNVVLRSVAGVYVEFIRNTPILVQLFIVYFGLPTLGIRLSADTAAMIALIFNFGAYATEIVRAGIEAIPRGQIEAAQSLGLSRWEIYRYVVILPALERVYPSLGSQFTLLMLGTSIISVIGASELTAAANSVQSLNFRSFEVYLIATGMYLILTLGFRMLLSFVSVLLFPRRRAVGVASQQVA
ncbi:amino acid ABC transporter permease [Mesorhizobium sp. SB112]|uniref:amino acid ABC transporter permease n=1 Tax=Mesorhizobium sp. SB112 TaxID=3151853 RepID=UPI003264031F